MKKYILLAAAAISLAACTSEDNYIDEPVAAQISATIGESALSRASNDTWDKGDKIGISMSGRYYNFKYTTENTDGIFSGTIMYFKNKLEPVTITAYYPFAGTEGEIPAVIEASTRAELQTADEQTNFDFLYASKENVTGSDPNVSLSFSHMMSKLTLVFKNGNIGTDVSRIKSCVISGLVLDGTFNPATGDCSAKAGAPTADLTIYPTVVNETALPSLILFPQEVTAVTLKIKDNEDQDYICELRFGDNHRLEPGNNYLYTITVKKTELSVDHSIVDWITEPMTEEAKPYDSDESDDESQS